MNDKRYMQMALREAKKGLGKVEPNPMVGCVIVKGGKVVGKGYHREFGGGHAEVNALADAGGQAKGSTVYVTLEPCCHHGKTGPCSQALIDAGVREVIVGVREPVASRRGKGIGQMKRAGIKVRVIEDADLCEALEGLLRAFARVMQTGLPWVVGKWASTVDGYIATRAGDSQWITNEKARAWVHRMRGRMDVILTGIGTVEHDDPMLNARGVRVKRVAKRVVVDPGLKIGLETKLVRSARDSGLVIVGAGHGAMRENKGKVEALRELGVEVVGVKKKGAGLDLKALMETLVRDYGVTNVMTECGGGLLGSLFRERLVNEVCLFMGGKLLGDCEGVSAVNLGGAGEVIGKMDDAVRLRLEEVKRFEGDVMLRYLT